MLISVVTQLKGAHTDHGFEYQPECGCVPWVVLWWYRPCNGLVVHSGNSNMCLRFYSKSKKMEQVCTVLMYPTWTTVSLSSDLG